MDDIFEQKAAEELQRDAPLAERMRPRTIDEVMGQEHLLADGGLLRQAVERDRLFSLIFWGPPGCGKTTLARLLALGTKSRFIQFSAVGAGVGQIREAVVEAKKERAQSRRTIVFVDEIHRFNKAQQDGFLGHVESGLITLVGATTENPGFEVIAPLLSRCRVLTVKALSSESLAALLDRAVSDPERGLGSQGLTLSAEARDILADAAGGDARKALNSLETAAFLAKSDPSAEGAIGPAHAAEALQKRTLSSDKAGESHYNLISALHKSLRDSDPDGAVYWLYRMLDAGEDPLYIARRMVRFATEDVGNADPNALSVTIAARDAYHFLGSPEGELALCQAACYLATAPKSNACYMAEKAVRAAIAKTGALEVPMVIRNAPTSLMRQMGYGKGYLYAHDAEEALVLQEHLPPELSGSVFYEPRDRGYEKTVKDRLSRWREYLAAKGREGAPEKS